ncbi:hypothetical protein SAMN02799624_02013 [Paenibacillus sp. UNC496MF]|nr:hypothetical protein SAMN02799624_02013 [Paenibacillus sp. UNC496MF]
MAVTLNYIGAALQVIPGATLCLHIQDPRFVTKRGSSNFYGRRRAPAQAPIDAGSRRSMLIHSRPAAMKAVPASCQPLNASSKNR